MSVRISDASNVLLYDSVTGLPLLLEVFESEEQAAAFLDFAAERGVDLRRARPQELDLLSGEFHEDWAVRVEVQP